MVSHARIQHDLDEDAAVAAVLADLEVRITDYELAALNGELPGGTAAGRGPRHHLAGHGVPGSSSSQHPAVISEFAVV